MDTTEKEITLFDVFEDIAKGWYLFLFALIASSLFSFVYFNSQKDIYNIELGISKIDDVQRFSLPEDLKDLNLFYYFHTNLKSNETINDIIKSQNLFNNIIDSENHYFDYMQINLGEMNSSIQFTTPDLKEIDKNLYIQDVKFLILSLLKQQEEVSFRKLEKRYSDFLVSLENQILDEQRIFNQNKKSKNNIFNRELLEELEKMNVVFMELEERLSNNLEIAKNLQIEKPQVYQSKADRNFSINTLNNQKDEILESLLSIVVLNDQPLYNYGSIILEKEIELLSKKRSSYSDNSLIKLKEIENEFDQEETFQDTELYIELLNKISENNRYIQKLELLESTGFKFAVYDADDFIIVPSRVNIIFIFIFSSIVTLGLAFLINLFIQYKKN
tara:strand:+ start:15225 stop:16388 length:1164 start_codon:yes stop_codon:yes gene_type:complete